MDTTGAASGADGGNVGERRAHGSDVGERRAHGSDVGVDGSGDDETAVTDGAAGGHDDAGTPADRVVLSYRAPGAGEESADAEWVLQDSGWILDGLREPSYRRYVGVVHEGPVAEGDEFEEFVNCGCASPMDVILRVEAVEGGDAIGPETTIAFVPRRDVLRSGAAAIAGAE